MQVLYSRPSISGNTTSNFSIYNQSELSSVSSTMFFQKDTLPDNLQVLIEKIKRFQGLPNIWDSYEAEIISPMVVDDAIKFIYTNFGKKLPFYFAAPGVNGEVMIELKQGSRAAEIFFNPNRSTELLLYENNFCRFEGKVDSNIEELISFFNEEGS